MRQLLQGDELLKLRADKIDREQRALEEKENAIRRAEDALAQRERSTLATIVVLAAEFSLIPNRILLETATLQFIPDLGSAENCTQSGIVIQ